jgi:hypothetical protein
MINSNQMRNQSAKCNQTLGSELTKIQLVNYVLFVQLQKIVNRCTRHIIFTAL